jgi:hypothetical protein
MAERDARIESFKLVAEGVHKTAPNKFASLYSCVVPPGTKAEIISYDPEARNGLGLGTVRVTEGQYSDCKGVVIREQMSPAGEQEKLPAAQTPLSGEVELKVDSFRTVDIMKAVVVTVTGFPPVLTY